MSRLITLLEMPTYRGLLPSMNSWDAGQSGGGAGRQLFQANSFTAASIRSSALASSGDAARMASDSFGIVIVISDMVGLLGQLNHITYVAV